MVITFKTRVKPVFPRWIRREFTRINYAIEARPCSNRVEGTTRSLDEFPKSNGARIFCPCVLLLRTREKKGHYFEAGWPSGDKVSPRRTKGNSRSERGRRVPFFRSRRPYARDYVLNIEGLRVVPRACEALGS